MLSQSGTTATLETLFTNYSVETPKLYVTSNRYDRNSINSIIQIVKTEETGIEAFEIHGQKLERKRIKKLV